MDNELKPCPNCNTLPHIGYLAREFFCCCTTHECDNETFVKSTSFLQVCSAWNKAIVKPKK